MTRRRKGEIAGMRKFLGFVLLVVTICGSALAADEYKIDPSHSSVGFSVTHMVVSTVNGRFNECDGKIILDEKDPSKSSVTVTIKAASINTDNQQRDTHLRSGDFLDAQNHPDISFQSKSVEKKGDRMDYGVSWSKSLDKGQLVVSNDVKIDINVEAHSAPPAAGTGK
jgi:polyisoprenoid-binding protein YceI